MDPKYKSDYAGWAVDWPKDPKSGRLLCSPQHLMPAHASNLRWAHTNVKEQDNMDSDYRLYYECKDCGYKWSEEMPD